jgi:hydrogenase nickel incorporation protein HypA/HybF
VHELSIAATLLEMVEKEARKAGLSRVVEVKIRVGPMSGVSVDSLTFCFGALSDKSEWKGSKLNVEVPPGVMSCRTCGGKSDFTRMTYMCPVCGSTDVAVEASRALELCEIRGE